MRPLLSLFAFLVLPLASYGQEEKRIVVGYVEKVGLPALDLEMKAKLDTGATTSSINATIVEEPDAKQKGKAQYVVFAVKTEDGESKQLRREVTRWVKIKKKGSGFIRRPTITMVFNIAGQEVEEEVNLSDRDSFNYNLLIGRNMLKKGKLVVDPSLTFTAKTSPVSAKKEG